MEKNPDTIGINSHIVQQNKHLPDEELLSCSHCTPSGKEFFPCSQCTPSGRTLLRQSRGARIPNKWNSRDWTQPTGRRRRECSILDNMAPAKDWCKIPAVQNTTSVHLNQKMAWRLFIYYIQFYTLVILEVSIPRHSFRITFMMNVKRKVYTGWNRRNVPNFGRVFLMLNYTEKTQNTYIQSWTVTEIMARVNCVLLAGPRTVPSSWPSYQRLSFSVVSDYGNLADTSTRVRMHFRVII